MTDSETNDASRQRFVGQNALVTGGGSGIGLATAIALARQGAQVTIMGRTEDKLAAGLDAITTETGHTARIAIGDVALEADVEAAVATAAGEEGLHLAVINAGTGGAGLVTDTGMDEWRRVLDTNLTGAFTTMKHAGAAITAAGGGSICAVSSIAGRRTHRFMAPYCVSKAGLEMLVATAADELGPSGVRVNAVAPGLVETDLTGAIMGHGPLHADYLVNTPLGRHGQSHEIAAAIEFLLSADAAWITGAILPIDGGHHLRRGPNLDAAG